MLNLMKKGFYKNSTGSNTFNANIIEGRSYGWWLYVREYKGNVIFNSHYFSSTTAKHQSEMRQLLYNLGVNIDYVVNTENSLDDINEALSDYIKEMLRERKELGIKIETKGTRKTTNEDRKERINEINEEILRAKELL